MASSYLLSARLEVSGASQFVSDMEKAAAAAKEAAEVLGKLKNISINVEVNGAKDFTSDMEKAAKTAKEATDQIESHGTAIVKFEAGGVQQFTSDLETAAQTAKESTEQIRNSTANVGSDLDEATKKTGFLRNAFGELLDSAKTLGKFQLVLGIQQGLQEATQAILDFDKGITNALSIQPQSAAFRGEMEATARSIAVDLGIPIGKVSESFYFLASAGYSVEQQLAAIRPVATFAKAGLFDIEKATELATQATAIFAKQGRSLPEILDEISQAANLSQGTIGQFADALTNKAGTAAVTYGQTLESTLGFLSAFAERGIAGKVAGEQYAIVLRDLAIKALKNKDAFEAMNVSVFDANGKMRPLLDITQQLQTHFAGMSDAQRTAELTSAGFALRSQQVILNLLQMGDRAAYFTDKMKEAGGVTQQVADVQLTSLSARLDRLKAITIDFAITGYEKLVEAGVWLRDTFEPALQALTPAAQAFARGFAVVAGALGTLAFEGVVRGLEATATALAAIGNFASEHADAMYAFGAALASIVALQAATSFAGWAQSLLAADGAIAPVIGSVKALAGQMSLLAGAIVTKDFGQAAGVFDSMLASINPLTISVVGLGVAAAIMWKHMQDEAKLAKERVELVDQALRDAGVATKDFGEAMSNLRGDVAAGGASFDELATKARNAIGELLTSEVVKNDAGQAFAELGISVSTAAAALSSGTTIFEQHAGILTRLKDAAAGPPGPLREVAAAILEAYNSGRLGNSGLYDLVEAFDKTASGADAAYKATADFAKVQLNTALATGELSTAQLHSLGITDLAKASVQQLVDAYSKFKGVSIGEELAHDEARFRNLASLTPDVAAGLGDVATNLSDVAGEGEPVASTIDDITTKTADSTKEFNKLTDAINGLIDGPLAAFDAETGLAKAMDSLVASVSKNGIAFDSATKAGQANREELVKMSKAMRNYAEAQAEGDPAKYLKGMEAMRQQFIDFAVSLGFPIEQATLLADQLGLTEGVKKTVVQVEEENAAATKAKIDEAAANRATTVAVSADTSAATTEIDGWAHTARATTVAAHSDTAPASTEIDGWARTARSTTVTAAADTGQAEAALATTTRVRTAPISAVADALLANADLDWVARGRLMAISAVTDASAALGTNATLDWVARYRESAVNAITNAAQANAALDYAARDRVSWLTIIGQYAGASQQGALPLANGGIVESYATGGMRERHVAQIAPAGAMRLWAEPETGGEAYIPLAASKRRRSLEVWMATGKRLGAIPYASGGMNASTPYMAARWSGGGAGVNVAPGAIAVTVSAAVGADPAHLSRLIGETIKPALDEFALDLSTAIQRRQS